MNLVKNPTKMWLDATFQNLKFGGYYTYLYLKSTEMVSIWVGNKYIVDQKGRPTWVMFRDLPL